MGKVFHHINKNDYIWLCAEPFEALRNCIDLDFNMLVTFEVHCVQNPEMFSSKKILFFSTEEKQNKKTTTKH